jgi:hypothetical protein
MSGRGYKSDDPLEISSTDTKHRSPGVLYLDQEGLVKIERNPPACGLEKRPPELPYVQSGSHLMHCKRYKKLTEVEFQASNDCESEHSGTSFHTTEEVVAFENQEHFNEPLKLIVTLFDNSLKTLIKHYEVAKPKDHYGEGEQVMSISLKINKVRNTLVWYCIAHLSLDKI